MMSQKNKTKRNNSKPKNIRNGMNLTPSKPPQLNIKVEARHTFRYTNTSAGPGSSTATILLTDLFSSLMMVTVNASTQVSLITALKLNRIRLWQAGQNNGGSQAGPGTIAFEIDNISSSTGFGIKPINITDTSYVAAQMARLTFKPNKNTPFAQWQNTTTTTTTTGTGLQMKVTAYPGDIMDITLDLLFNVNDPVLAVSLSNGPVTGRIIGAAIPLASPSWTPTIIPVV